LVFRGRPGLRRGLLLLELLLLFLLCHVMADRAAGGRAQNGVMAGDVSSHGTDSGAFEASLGQGALRTDQQCKTQQRRGERLPFRRGGP
jgi:hypothetical protein